MNSKPVPPPSCPESCRVNRHVPMVHVADVDRSISFYGQLGFACDSRFSTEEGVTNWAMLSSGRGQIMFAKASGPVAPDQQAVLFYMYSPDVLALRRHLLDGGLPDGGWPPGEEGLLNRSGSIPAANAVFEPRYPFYMPDGEVRIHDPDGYCILVGQIEQ